MRLFFINLANLRRATQTIDDRLTSDEALENATNYRQHDRSEGRTLQQIDRLNCLAIAISTLAMQIDSWGYRSLATPVPFGYHRINADF